MHASWFYISLITDAGIFFSPAVMSPRLADMFIVLGTHSIAAALLAAAMFPAMPAQYRRQKVGTIALLFVLSFMAPVIGPIFVILLVRVGLGGLSAKELLPLPQTINLPEFDLRSKGVDRTAQGAIRSRLAKHVPEKMRMQSLLTLQAVPNSVANPILEGLLSDDTDDIRLIAFGMLDAKEKALSQLIQRERTQLDAASGESERYESLRNLAELHWELIYASLAQGELRQHMLEMALAYARKAANCSAAAEDAPLALLTGRILMALGHQDEARVAFEHSRKNGQPGASVLPYLAELAFRRQDYAEVSRLMHALSAQQSTPRVRALVDIWTGRDSSKVFHDRRFLPHL